MNNTSNVGDLNITKESWHATFACGQIIRHAVVVKFVVPLDREIVRAIFS